MTSTKTTRRRRKAVAPRPTLADLRQRPAAFWQLAKAPELVERKFREIESMQIMTGGRAEFIC